MNIYGRKDNQRFIEIGGFPGTFALWFHQEYGYDATILDYYMDENVVHKLERKNGYKEGTLNCINCDFFTYNTFEKYDFVFSAGFIEHFDDTKDVIKRHFDLISDNGSCFILIPNFLGLNGWLQKKFNKRNYDAHNLESMKIPYLREILNELGVKNATVGYVAKPMLWLSTSNRPLSIGVNILNILVKFIPIPCRLLSSYIYISAIKNIEF